MIIVFGKKELNKSPDAFPPPIYPEANEQAPAQQAAYPIQIRMRNYPIRKRFHTHNIHFFRRLRK